MSHDHEEVWRRELPRVLSALTRRYGHFEHCEDAVQLAVMAAAEQWPVEGVPRDPRAWMLRVASRRLADQLRQDERRRAREEKVARLDDAARPLPEEEPAADQDDLLELMVLCCHRSLSRTSQVALALRAVAGLTTREIAAGFLVPEATMAQRISRAKATLTVNGARLESPAPCDLPERLLAVRHVISLLYTQGHLPTEGPMATDVALRTTAIGLARQLLNFAPADPENTGLLALLLLSEARAPTRVDDAGDLVPLKDQDRTRWNHDLIQEGTTLLESALPQGYVGSFQLQAAIAAVHADASTHADTDWAQALALYEMLRRVAPSTATTIGWATAVAEVDGPGAGLDALNSVDDIRHHRYHAVRGHLLARLGDIAGARQALTHAAQVTHSIPEQRYLNHVIGELD